MKIAFRWPTLFERLIYYFLLPEIIAKIIYEIVLRVPAITVTQPKQYMFYGFLALEYLFIVVNYKNFRPAWRHINVVWILLLVMILHGVAVGLWWGNSLTRTGIDTINVAVVLVNIILLSDPYKIANTAFDRIFFANRLYGVTMVVLSVAAMAVNPTSGIKLGSAAATSVSMSLIFVELYLMRGLSVRNIGKGALGLLLIAATAQDWNRTTLVFNSAAVLILLARRAGSMPFRTAFIGIAAVLVVAVAFAVMPEDSALSRRISGLQEVDLSARSGSIGERQAEADAVDDKIAALGAFGEIFGAGHGASYDVKYTWEWKLDYSNAHYGWVLFYLRYGMLGYVYMALWILILVISAAKRWRSGHPAAILVCLLSIWNVGYLGTYGYFSFFIAGLPFVTPVMRRRMAYDWQNASGGRIQAAA